MSAYSSGHAMSQPYPAHLASTWTAPDGQRVTIRPIRPEDAGIEREFVNALSPEARYMRFMSTLKELPPAMLARFTQVDYDREMALIAVIHEDGREGQIGVGRYIINPDGESCEFAIVVAETWQGRGLGRHLMLQLIAIARVRRLKTMVGQVLAANTQMLGLATALGFIITEIPQDASAKEVRLAL